jgi:hypothetical protein
MLNYLFLIYAKIKYILFDEGDAFKLDETMIYNELEKNKRITYKLLDHKRVNTDIFNNAVLKKKVIKKKMFKNKNEHDILLKNIKKTDMCLDAAIINEKIINIKIIKNKILRDNLIKISLVKKLIKYKLNIGDYYDIKKILKLHNKNYDENDDEVAINHLDYVVKSGLSLENKEKWYLIPSYINNKVHPI